MPVIDQIAEATDRFFDSAESANKRARTATTDFVTRVQKRDLPLVDRVSNIELPYADRLPTVDLNNLPLVDRLPEPVEAVNATFDLIDSGIEFNRSMADRIVERFGDSAETIEATATKVEKPAAKTAPATKKAPAKKSTAKKPATKATAKKAPAKKATTKKAAAKK